MREIGVRELKQSLSETLKSVSRGEHVRVTVRGRPIADLVPAGAADEDDQIRRLIVAGRLTPSTRPHPAGAPRLARARQSASALVLAERDAEN